MVSIIIPVYNREKLVRRCIESALQQTYKDIEIIVVDNCSTDDTFKVLQEYSAMDKRVKVFQNAENLGPVRNWARGIAESSGEYIKILWSDDWITEDFVEKTLPLLEQDKEAAFVYTPTFIHTPKKVHMLYCRGRGRRHSLESFVKSFLFNWLRHPSSPGNAIFRAKDIKDNLVIDIPNELGFDFNRYGAGNDRLLFLKCFPKYKYFYITRKAMSHFLSHDDSFTASNDLSSYYIYSVKYFVENQLKDTRWRQLFNAGLYWTNKFSNDKFKGLLFPENPQNKWLKIKVIVGKIVNSFWQSWIWEFSKK
jgi:glycosyltransferase involved in cell wall biosynthesis